MNEQQSFREGLLRAGAPNDRPSVDLEREIQTMLVRKLTTGRTIFVGVVALISAVMGGFFLYGATLADEIAGLGRLAMGIGSLFALGWFALLLNMLRKGELNVRMDGRRTAQLAWVFTVIMNVLFMIVGFESPDRSMGILLVIQSLAYLVMAGVYWVSQRVEEAELTLREQLLRLEMSVAKSIEGREPTSP